MGGLSLDIRALDRRGYRESLSHQERLVAARLSGDIGDQLLLTEHDPVVTVGRGGDLDQLRVGEARLTAEGIGLYQVDRGGGASLNGRVVCALGDRGIGRASHPQGRHDDGNELQGLESPRIHGDSSSFQGKRHKHIQYNILEGLYHLGKKTGETA